MYAIHPMPPQIDEALRRKFLQVEPATIGHVRNGGFADPALRPVIADGRIVAGTAVTMTMPNIDGTIGHLAFDHLRRGDILVIDRGGDDRHAAWGGVLAVAAQLIGLEAVIIDGRACDFREIRDSGVNVWCRGPSAITCKKTGLGGALNIPVSCGGVTVNPGDIVVADDSGIVFLDPAGADGVANLALAMQARERDVTLPALRSGARCADVTGARAVASRSAE